MRLDIMVDIETLGTKSDSTIIQLSAVAFNIQNGEKISWFDHMADIELNKEPIVCDGGTIKWWMTQKPTLLNKILTKGMFSSEEVLEAFRDWVMDFNVPSMDIYLWGNGILFDNNILKTQMEWLGLGYPIFYRNDRDVRTILELASQKLDLKEKDIHKKVEEIANEKHDRKLEAHDALDDCLYQVELVQYCHDVLTESLEATE